MLRKSFFSGQNVLKPSEMDFWNISNEKLYTNFFSQLFFFMKKFDFEKYFWIFLKIKKIPLVKMKFPI